MHLIHEATIKNPDGVIDIHLYIVNDHIKKYTYHLESEFAARQFHFLYRKGKGMHGAALKILNRFKIRKEEPTI